ncbi:MASE1 domain-containing protein [Streptomyces sp. NPDC096310]|uniref:MASE1 domain-containing protein n=1 Tax=Streptomyces sp. NPDC096310 TaxID=3366082 RepID=UPI00381658E7
MVRTDQLRRLTVRALPALGVAVAYYAFGQLGLVRQVRVEGAIVTPLWPPTGVALGCLLHLGLGVWPGISLGALLSIVTISTFHPADVVIIAGNTLAPVCAYLMLRRAGFRLEVDRLRDGVALVFLGALGGMLISATVGTGVLVLSDRLPHHGFWPTWTAWWTGDAMGVLVVTPLLLLLRRVRLPGTGDRAGGADRDGTDRSGADGDGADRARRHGGRWAEAAALLVTAVIVTLVAARSPLCLLFLVFPLLIWAALRFQLAGSAPCALLVSVVVIWAATDHVGPFTHHDLTETMISIQALNGSVALTGLLLAAIVTEQRNIRRKVEQACMELAEVVGHLAPDPPGRRTGSGLSGNGAEGSTAEGSPSEGSPSEGRASEGRTSEGRTAEGRDDGPRG